MPRIIADQPECDFRKNHAIENDEARSEDGRWVKRWREPPRKLHQEDRNELSANPPRTRHHGWACLMRSIRIVSTTMTLASAVAPMKPRIKPATFNRSDTTFV
uniref:Uncharacterized protein n=1 Tax=Burkholderia sp. M701 TaxID=326454 RepID=V5YMY9_9BURK|nr:hypothetical protein [Burkholderia sp. M701]